MDYHHSSYDYLSFICVFFYTGLQTGPCRQFATYFYHTLINMKMLWMIKASICWLHTKVAWVSLATLTSKNNKFWDTALYRYMTPQSWQNKLFLRKSYNRLILIVLISKLCIFDGREYSFALKYISLTLKSTSFFPKMLLKMTVWKS